MKIIAAVGRNASGKDELAGYLHRRCAVPVLSSGDLARDMAREQGVQPTRANLHRLSRRAMAEHGEDFFMQRLIDEIEAHDWRAVAISGVCTPADALDALSMFMREQQHPADRRVCDAAVSLCEGPVRYAGLGDQSHSLQLFGGRGGLCDRDDGSE